MTDKLRHELHELVRSLAERREVEPRQGTAEDGTGSAIFRDPDAWLQLAERALPQIVAAKSPDRMIRVWSAGCASGADAYSLAVLFACVLGEEGYRERVRIYATDADAGAIRAARTRGFARPELGPLPEGLIERFFERVDGRLCLRRDLRRAIVFGRHDLVTDAPISRMALVICRDTVHHGVEQADRVLDRLHYALADDGWFYVGPNETLIRHAGLFAATEIAGLFRKIPHRGRRAGAMLLTGAARSVGHGPAVPSREAALRDAAFEDAVAAQVLIDGAGHLVLANQRARDRFGLLPSDIGRPLRDVQLCYRPVELTPHLERVMATGAPITLDPAAWPGQTTRSVVVELVPLRGASAEVVGVSVAFREATTAPPASRRAPGSPPPLPAEDATLVTDASGVIAEVNAATATLLDVDLRYLAGKPLAAFLAAGPVGIAQWLARPLGASGEQQGALTLLGRNGAVVQVWASVRSHPLGLQWRLREPAPASDTDPQRDLAHGLVRAQEAERRRIALLLHDELGQRLTATLMMLGAGQRSGPEALEQAVAAAREQLQTMVQQVRELSLDLRPSMLDDQGLLPAVAWLARRLTNETALQVSLVHSGPSRRFHAEVELAAFRIVQEGLTNTLRHAGVHRATVRVWADGSHLGVQVQDAGAGFDPAAPRGPTTGLSGMAERARACGGTFTLDTVRGVGTRVTAEFPI